MPRAKTSSPAVQPTLQSLIRAMMRDLERDFADIVEAKLDALIATELAPPAWSRAPATRPSPSSAPSASRRRRTSQQKPVKRVAAASSQRPRKAKAVASRTSTADLVSSIIDALSSGASLGKSALLKAAGLSDGDAERVHAALKQLRASGTVVMTGSKRGTAYRLASVQTKTDS
ncbi:MAG: hypothetical protein ACHREM_05045 [Polyangiales bacterium]